MSTPPIYGDAVDADYYPPAVCGNLSFPFVFAILYSSSIEGDTLPILTLPTIFMKMLTLSGGKYLTLILNLIL